MSPVEQAVFSDFSRALIRRATVAVSTPIRAAAAENCSARATPRKKRMSSQSIVDNLPYPLKKALGSGRGVERQVMVLDRGERSASRAKGIQVSHGC